MVTVCASNARLAVLPKEKREKERDFRLWPPTPYYATLYGPILPQAEVAAQTASPVRRSPGSKAQAWQIIIVLSFVK